MTRLIATSAIALCAATPLFAQDAACPAVGSNGQWIGGSAAASDIATMDSYGEQMALVLNGNRYASVFSLSAPTSTRIEAQGRANGDPVLTLYDPAGDEILTDDDSGGNGAARAEVDLDAGTYCAVITSYDGGPMTAFVRIGRTEMDPLTEGRGNMPDPDPGATGTAGAGCQDAVNFGTLASGGAPLSIATAAGETGYLSFDLTEAMPVTITAENEDADPLISLSGPDGENLGENDDFDGLNARLDIATPLAPGTYCIALNALSDEAAPIDVTVAAYDPEAALMGLYARGEAAPPLDGSVQITDLGTLETVLRADIDVGSDTQWFRLDVPAAGLMVIEANAIGPSGDPWLVVFDVAGREIAQNDDTPSGTDAQVMPRVNAETYLIGVKQVGDRQGFVRLLLERFVPAQ
ncbi:DVUA0089 family protein [Loktanella sp. TSTF-M6]|uniref:DVUA0089 family protein n=1 Tax=Loktanella gaetbuli TaxID=2881335 RepID=A0ABS8BUM8_9RHOB|nr:DVUA0089 family protein [Loktanella gaetbuli]MCB5199420.1 DVUA0089 family protein [Loktanella gaetbuli]